MTDRKLQERQAATEQARERAFDSLLEQEFGGEPPVATILKRAQQSPRRSHSPARAWLVAALVILGVGVTVTLSWYSRLDREANNAATPQDPTPVEVMWPDEVPRVVRPEQLSELPRDTTHLSMSLLPADARDLSRLRNLKHLHVRLTPSKLAKVLRSGGAGQDGRRLDRLAGVPTLRHLSMDLSPLAAADIDGLEQLKQLQVLELSSLIEDNEAFRNAAAKGGEILTRPFDRDFGAAIAAATRIRTLRVTNMPITAGGIRALAKANLHSLILDGPVAATPEILEALGELTTLRHLELISVDGGLLGWPDAADARQKEASALTTAVMKRIAALPMLQSLTLGLCYLDPEVTAALPRRLQRLDLSRCFDVDKGLGDVVAQMPKLRILGLPLVMAQAQDFHRSSMWRVPITGSDLHTRRLSGAEAAAIINRRAWQGLHLDGQLTKEVTDALVDQTGLQELVLTSTAGSESLAFVAQMPKLEKVTLLETNVAAPMLQQLNGCASLRTVVFRDCLSEGPTAELNKALRADIARRWNSRVVR